MIRALGLVLALLAATPAQAQGLLVEAEGRARIQNTADIDAARRRALADALVNAALMGGAELAGYSAMDRGRVVSDTLLLRPAGRVLSHRLLSAGERQGYWVVRIAAQVGERAEVDCTPARARLLLVAEPAVIRVDPTAPAWAQPLAARLGEAVLDRLSRHSAVSLRRVSALADAGAERGIALRRPAALDYAALTAGRAPPRDNEIRLAVEVRLTRRAGALLLELTLALDGDSAPVRRLVLRREAELPGPVLVRDLGELAAPRRPQIEAALLDGLDTEIDTHLARLTCQPPSAPLVLGADGPRVALGRDNGLTPSSLAFLEDHEAGLGVFLIAELGAQSARLVPLDATQPLAPLAGRRVRFAETGVPP